MLSDFRNDTDKLQTNTDTGDDGSFLSILNNTFGSCGNANVGRTGESKDEKWCFEKDDKHFFSGLFNIYGIGKTDFRSALVYGYYRWHYTEYRLVLFL